jgi:hypothetical protein
MRIVRNLLSNGIITVMLQESMNEIKVENDLEIVCEGYFIPMKTDQEDMPPTFSGQKSESEVNLFMDEVVGGCASVCVCVCVCFFCRSFLTIHTIILFE